MLALGLCAADPAPCKGGVPPEIDGYGDPMPWDGISRFDELLRVYAGTSFKTRSSGTEGPFCCG